MATLGDLKARIADELLKRNLTAQIAKAIPKAIEHYAGRRWWFNTGRMVGAATATDADGFIALPTGTRLIDEIRVGSNTLERRPPEWLDEWLALSPARGDPFDYSPYGDRIRVYPVPTGPISIVVVGTFDLAPLTDDSSSNAWTNEAEDLICARSKMRLYRDVLRDPEGALLAKAAMEEAETDLNMKTIRRVGTGRVRGYL